MAKQGLLLNQIFQLVKPETDWSICIGAGASFPIFPSWTVLANELAQHMGFQVPTEDKYKSYLSPDIIIQSTYELLGRPETFATSLSNILYEKLFEGLSKEDKQLVIDCLTTQTPVDHLDWRRYVEILQSKGQTTTHCLAEYIAASIYESNRPPKSIISFNAELLLPSLINAYTQVNFGKHHKVLNYITEPTSSQYHGRINYFFCHGLVSVPESHGSVRKNFNSEDKLVFAENEYLQLANSSFSWQSYSFMNTLLTSTVFFVGLSFTDPNVRRWLSWIHKCKTEAIKRFNPKAIESTSYYWVEKFAKEEKTRRWIEASVAHLGVRLVWVNEYSDIVDVLTKSIK